MALCLWMCVFSSVGACAQEIGIVTASALSMRTGPDTTFAWMCDIPKGTQLQLLTYEENGWYRIGYDGCIGYVIGRYVRVAQSTESKGAPGMLPGASALSNPAGIRAFVAPQNNPGYP
ncbi:MAG: SH3 domain-containing protein, partial [Clostridia bacterium]